MNKRVHHITEGSMMVALVGIALLINRQFAGILEYALYWILTFPILIYTIRYGVQKAIVVSVCMLLIGFMLSVPTTIFYLFVSLLIGIAYGGGVRNKWSNSKLLWVTGIFTLISYIITTIVFAQLFGYDPMEDLQLVTSMLNTFQINGIAIGELVKVITILSTLLLSVLQTFCIHLIAYVLMRRLHIEAKPMKTIYDIQVPKFIGYVSIIIWVLFFVSNMVKLNESIRTDIISIWLVMFLVTVAYGSMTLMSILALCGKRNWIFVIVLLVFLPFINYAISFLGIFNICSDFTKKLKRGVMDGTIRKL